jgi:hypothetical protein
MKKIPVIPIFFFFFFFCFFLLLASLSFLRISKLPSSAEEEYNSRLFNPSQSKKFREKNRRNLDARKEINLKGQKKENREQSSSETNFDT